MKSENPTTCSVDPGQLMEFRCNHCWNSNYLTCDQEGKSVRCKYCDQKITVPEATPERVQRAIEAGVAARADAQTRRIEKITYAKPPRTQRELRKFEKQYIKQSFVSTDYSICPNASRTRRLVAQLIDAVFLTIAIVATAGLVVLADREGMIDLQKLAETKKFEPFEYVLVGFIPGCYFLVQWIFLSMLGQTIGKKITGIRIVKSNGSLPGFFRAVVLRNWLVRGAAAFMPFIGLVDTLFIFTSSRRCLHDYVAGTRVVEELS